jgi:Fic family protein
MSQKSAQPPAGITFLAGLDHDLRSGLASEIRALWTHHSTALEGNTLTLGDTTFILQEGLTVSGKSLKDHQEVIGHARAIDVLYHFIDQRRTLTVNDLHQLHRTVQTEMVSDIFAPIGAWKNEPNGTTALLSNGQTQWHDYARPNDVPALMDEWLSHLSQTREQIISDPLGAYTDLHLGFTTIHPYADGNGRLARLLANIPIIIQGLPPVLIPLERRRDYITLMGDWSIARGVPEINKPLIERNMQWEKLHAFFADVSQSARNLVSAYQQRQCERRK